jgi:hypothetical protein
MQMNSKLWVGAVCALLLQTGASLGDSSTTTPPTNQTNPSTACPKGQVMDKTSGVCVQPKPGQMGFDLDAPSDDNSHSSNSSNGSRDVGNGSSQSGNSGH